jgi:FolB domain-containing protein
MDKIIIKDLLVRGIIGINDWERESPQDILINIAIVADLSKAGDTDNVEDTINYRTVTKRVIAHTESASHFTVEALATDIANICLEESKAQGVQVRVEKPGALRFAKSVGVQIERSRQG